MEFKHKHFAYFAAFIISTLVMNANIFMRKNVLKKESNTLENAKVWLNVSLVKLTFINNE